MILVTGGAGFIGSHMAKLLRQLGEPHVILDNLSKGHVKAVGGSAFVQGDLLSRETLERVFEAHKIDCVLHFAAATEVGESVASPTKYYSNNVVATLNLVEAMRRHKVDKIVFSSTAAVYGEPTEVPIPENHSKTPTNPYGESKLAVERLLIACESAYGIRSVCLRYFNAAGSDPEGELGEHHEPETHLVPLVVMAGLGRQDKLKIFGSDYPTPDGTCVRDYVHICDLADAHWRAITELRNGSHSCQYNLGNGKGYSVRQVIEMAQAVLGREIPHECSNRRPGDPATLVARSDRIKSDWGWEPKYPEIKTIIEHAAAWLEKNPQGYAD